VTRTHTSPLVRFLRDPSRELTHSLNALEHAVSNLLPFAIVLAVCTMTVLVARVVLVRVREERLARGARVVELAVPPELDVDGALLLWSALHDLLRPRLARLVGGQPHIVWEIAADRGGSRFRLRVPAVVPPGLVERALASAWPGITSTQLDTAATNTDGGDEPVHER
jgi:hypothetical protein